MNGDVSDLLTRSAIALRDGEAASALAGDVRDLLTAFDYLDGAPSLSAARSRLLAAGAKLTRIFRLQSAEAPGLFFFGGEADPARISAELRGAAAASVSGCGTSLAQAFEACVGEAVEYLSQWTSSEDELEQASFRERAPRLPSDVHDAVARLLEHVDVPHVQPIDWVRLLRLGDGAATWLPADIVFRRPPAVQDFAAPFKMSMGCGAGPAFEAAALHGLLELIERDATSLWWRAGRKGRALPADSLAMTKASALLSQIRGETRTRQAWLLDITSDLGVPSIAAISCDHDGFGFACGMSAKLSSEAAAISAIGEMCQMELAQHVAAAKLRERGAAALNELDRRHLERRTGLDTRTCELLYPEGVATNVPDSAESNVARNLQTLTAKLAASGIRAYVLNLTRPQLGIPVARILCPRLQLAPSTFLTSRLSSAAREGGGLDALAPLIGLF